MIKRMFLGLIVLASASSASALELVVNGGFEQTSLTGSSQFGDRFAGQVVTGWNSTGLGFLMFPGQADTPGAVTGEYGGPGSFELYGPNDGFNNGLPAASPVGGNYVAADGDSGNSGLRVDLSQTINGLTLGKNYNVSFWWAAAQQRFFFGDTTESWEVSFGNQTQSTGFIANPEAGFQPWRKATMLFTANNSSEVLNFLAVGTPSGLPPFSLLDGVSVTAAVPEPASWAMLIAGFGLIGAAARRRRLSEVAY